MVAGFIREIVKMKPRGVSAFGFHLAHYGCLSIFVQNLRGYFNIHLVREDGLAKSCQARRFLRNSKKRYGIRRKS
jgi:hypothetical protein